LPDLPLRLVLDTNVLLAGLAAESSASQRIVDLLSARKAIPLLSRPVVGEYREVLLHPQIAGRFPKLTPKRVERALNRLRYVGEEILTDPFRFVFERDPRDAKFIELAIAGSATHIISLDNDILSLPTAKEDAGKRFRQRLRHTQVLRPAEFLGQFARRL
jgi:putative PIN family toxin of toxin-antitoxin system